MSTIPEPVGLVAVIEVALFTVYEVAGVLPNVTPVVVKPVPVKPVPVIVTELPPSVEPAVGEMPVTAGTAA
jgi:hypothetical protein